MCGRYSAAKDLSELRKLIDFICRAPFFAPLFNIAPCQQAPVILLENLQPVMKMMRCGLIPSWASVDLGTDVYDQMFALGFVRCRLTIQVREWRGAVSVGPIRSTD